MTCLLVSTHAQKNACKAGSREPSSSAVIVGSRARGALSEVQLNCITGSQEFIERRSKDRPAEAIPVNS
jgi:hypothetical protein